MAHDVFICHSSVDKTVADAVCASLERRGIRCWVAPRDIMPGKSWPEAIVEAIATTRLMVVIFSSHSNASPQVVREVERAVNKNVIILPFRIQLINPSKSLEYFLSCPHWLDAIEPPLQGHIEQLAATAQRLLNPEPGTAANPMPAAVPPERRVIRDLHPDQWGAARPGKRSLFDKLFGESS